MTRITRFSLAFLWVVPTYGQTTDTVQTKPPPRTYKRSRHGPRNNGPRGELSC